MTGYRNETLLFAASSPASTVSLRVPPQETRLKGVLQLAGCRCDATSTVVDLRRNCFEVVATTGGTLNPLHAGKSVYRWIASTAAERDMWIKAIRVASGTIAPDSPAIRWRQLLQSCTAESRSVATPQPVYSRVALM